MADTQEQVAHKLLILWLVVTVKQDFLKPGGLSDDDLTKIADQLALPKSVVQTFVDNALTESRNPFFDSVAKDFPVLASGGGYDGPNCPKNLDMILSLAKGI